MSSCLVASNDQWSLDLSTDPCLKLHRISFPSAESVPVSTATIVWFFFSLSLKEVLSNCKSSMDRKFRSIISKWNPRVCRWVLRGYKVYPLDFLKSYYFLNLIDLATDPGLMSHLISHPCSEWAPAFTTTFI
jgi:hypothetical protein